MFSFTFAFVLTICHTSAAGPIVNVYLPLTEKVSPRAMVGNADCNKEESSVRTISFPETWSRSITAASETGTPRERERERERI